METCNWLPTPFACQLCALMAYLFGFPAVFNSLSGKCHWLSRSKEPLKRLFWPQNLLLIQEISNSTSCHTIQEIIALTISNQPHAAWLSDFEIYRPITPWIVLHLVQLPLQIQTYLRLLYENNSPTQGTPPGLSRLEAGDLWFQPPPLWKG